MATQLDLQTSNVDTSVTEESELATTTNTLKMSDAMEILNVSSTSRRPQVDSTTESGQMADTSSTSQVLDTSELSAESTDENTDQLAVKQECIPEKLTKQITQYVNMLIFYLLL